MFGNKKKENKSFEELHSEISNFVDRIDEAIGKGNQTVNMHEQQIDSLRNQVAQTQIQRDITLHKISWLQDVRKAFPESHKPTAQVSK